MKNKTKKTSLIKKTVVLIVCIAIVVCTVSIAIYNKGMYDVIIAQYGHYSTDVAKLIAVEIDAERLTNVRNAVLDIYGKSENKVLSDKRGTPEFEDYVSQYDAISKTDDYKAILAQLRKMQSQLDVDCIYVCWMDIDNECYVYIVDAAIDDPCPVGCIDPLYVDKDQVSDLSLGSAPNITNTAEYGWLISTGMPIYNGHGELIALSTVDINMTKAMGELKQFMLYIGLSFLGLLVLVCVLVIFLINKFIIKPINTLSVAASDYKNNRIAFSELKIKRRDEIGVLADSLIKMEKDIDGYIEDLVNARDHADRMDRAANIDALTGVNNKRAYDIEIKRLSETKEAYGMVLIDMNDLKGVNDHYGHEKGDIGLRTVCRIICKVFDPSSVYRVGGDEFVVILEGDNYEDRDARIEAIKEAFAKSGSDQSLRPWERVSAAVGAAVYDPETDESAEAVLKRADSAMYENKKSIKSAE